MDESRFVRTMALGELKDGGMLACEVAGREVIVCRVKGDVYVLDAMCTHGAARMDEGRLRGTRLTCPMHGASFDVRDGRVLGPPATEPLACHRVRVVDEHVEIEIR